MVLLSQARRQTDPVYMATTLAWCVSRTQSDATEKSILILGVGDVDTILPRRSRVHDRCGHWAKDGHEHGPSVFMAAR